MLSPETLRDTPAHGVYGIAAAAEILSERYRDFAHYNKRDPLDELLFIICSTRTHEGSYRNVYKAFRLKFPRNDLLLHARVSALEGALRFGGLSRKKAQWIKGIAQQLYRKFGRVTLTPLRKYSDDECERFLTTLPGVGKKVARCVMMYSLRRPVFPVDEHCWRIAYRMGWIRQTRRNRSGSPRDEDRLQNKIPEQLRFSLHVNLISLGREFCRSQKPKCLDCPLNMRCRKVGVASHRQQQLNESQRKLPADLALLRVGA